MKLLVTLMAILLAEFTYSESKRFSLPAHTAIAVHESPESTHVLYAESVDIVVTESSDGALTSPFRVVGYDTKGGLVLDRVFAENLYEEAENCAALSLSSKNATIMTNFLSVTSRSHHLRIAHARGEYIVSITRIAPLGVEFAKSDGDADNRKRVPIKWQRRDGNMQYYYSCEGVCSNAENRVVRSTPVGNAVLIGAVYQSRTEYSIKFKVCCCGDSFSVIAEGEVTGGISDGKLNGGKVVYKFGADKVKTEFVLSDEDGGSGFDVCETAIGQFEQHGFKVKHQTARLIVTSGDRRFRLNMRVMVDWPENG